MKTKTRTINKMEKEKTRKEKIISSNKIRTKTKIKTRRTIKDKRGNKTTNKRRRKLK